MEVFLPYSEYSFQWIAQSSLLYSTRSKGLSEHHAEMSFGQCEGCRATVSKVTRMEVYRFAGREESVEGEVLLFCLHQRHDWGQDLLSIQCLFPW
jgi:hypothetical protein